jgi:hypothetical protein
LDTISSRKPGELTELVAETDEMQWNIRYLILIAATAAAVFPIFFTALPAYSASRPTPDEAVSRVQLAAFMAPVRRANGRGGSAAVTPLLDLADDARIDEVCGLSPRIMDAFMTTLHRHPIKVRKMNSLQAGDLKKRLTDAANRALGRHMIGDVELISGVKPPKNAGSRFFKSAKCGQSKGH